MQWREIYFPLYSWNIFFVCFEGAHYAHASEIAGMCVVCGYVLLVVVASYAPSAQGVWGHKTQLNKGKGDPA